MYSNNLLSQALHRLQQGHLETQRGFCDINISMAELVFGEESMITDGNTRLYERPNVRRQCFQGIRGGSVLEGKAMRCQLVKAQGVCVPSRTECYGQTKALGIGG